MSELNKSRSRTGAIVLAAGKSSRMGCQKLLLPLGGRPMIRTVVNEIRASPCDHICVVVREGESKIQRALPGCQVTFAVNRSQSDDMLSSVRCGLQALPASFGWVLLALGDQPGLKRSLIARLISVAQDTSHSLVVPTYEGRRGHPLLFSVSCRDEVMTEFDGTGLRGLLSKHPDQVLEWPCESRAAIEDIDTLEDYDQLRNAFE